MTSDEQRQARFLVGVFLAVFMGLLQVLYMIHHAVKIRLGDAQEGWSISFAISIFVTPALIAAAITWATEK